MTATSSSTPGMPAAVLPAPRLEPQPDGSVVEADDIPFVTGRFWEEEDTPPKLRRGDALRGLAIEEVGTRYALCRDLFEDHARDVMFGPCIEGAVFELKLSGPAQLSMLDGYLTVPLEAPSHFHLCIGRHRGLGRNSPPPELARRRECSRASFRRLVHPERGPRSWQLELVNGAGEQMITFFLPSPYLSPAMKPLKVPDWGRLALWNALRARYLGEREPQPLPEVFEAGSPCG